MKRLVVEAADESGDGKLVARDVEMRSDGQQFWLDAPPDRR